MSETLKKFQILLEELFQFNCSDLDFGIYRIMNHKRQVIDNFIGSLPICVGKVFGISFLQYRLQEDTR